MLDMREGLLIENARVDVATGFVVDASGVAVPVTRYMRTGKHVRTKYLPLQPNSPTEPLDIPLVVAHNSSWRNYCHWLMQTAFCAWAWTRFPNQVKALFLTPKLDAFQEQILRLAGLDAAHHHQAASDAKLSTPLAVVMPDAFRPSSIHPSPRMGEFGRHVSMQIPAAGDTPRRLYVSRRDSTKRRLENEVEIEAALVRHGFSIVTLTGVSFPDQVRLFRNVEIVVGPHGAGFANLLFCQPGTRVIELTPSTYVNPRFVRLSKVCGLRHEVETFLAHGLRHETRWRADTERVLDALRRSHAAV